MLFSRAEFVEREDVGVVQAGKQVHLPPEIIRDARRTVGIGLNQCHDLESDNPALMVIPTRPNCRLAALANWLE